MASTAATAAGAVKGSPGMALIGELITMKILYAQLLCPHELE